MANVVRLSQNLKFDFQAWKSREFSFFIYIFYKVSAGFMKINV